SVPTNQVSAYEARLLEDVRANGKKILEAIRTKKALDADIEKEMNAFLQSFTQGYIGSETKAAA
ncbi:MAG TPA: F0F1 ATP synthase subunit alpha, partial [Micavibrio sp.]